MSAIRPGPALPFHFDTTTTPRLVLRLFGLLTAVMAAGAVWLAVVRGDGPGALGSLLCAGLSFTFGRVLMRHLIGVVGTLDERGVRVEPGRHWGLRFQGPVGDFALGRFSAVRIDLHLSLQSLQECGRVILCGKPGTPDIQIATLATDEALALGSDLASRLGLGFERRSVAH